MNKPSSIRPNTAARLMAASLILIATNLSAHHGFGGYSTEDFEITGTVTGFFFGNPHPRVALEVYGEIWDVWLAAYGRTVFACFDANVLSVGDTMHAIGHRVPDRAEMKTTKVEHNGRLFNFYPPDNPDRGPNADPNRKREGPCFYEIE